MKNDICLSIEQMKHLEELGLDTSDASMQYEFMGMEISLKDEPDTPVYELRSRNIVDIDFPELKDIPTYTLQDILEKLPNELILPVDNGKDSDSFNKNLQYNFDDNEWYCLYQALMGDDLICFHNPSSLEAAYQMLLWCIDNGHIKTK